MSESTEIVNNCIQVFHEREAARCRLLYNQLLRTRGVVAMLIATLIQNTYKLSTGLVHYGPPFKRIVLIFS